MNFIRIYTQRIKEFEGNFCKKINCENNKAMENVRARIW